MLDSRGDDWPPKKGSNTILVVVVSLGGYVDSVPLWEEIEL
jgi:hypothetical protein